MADWKLFYQRLESAHREFVSALIADWQRTGGVVELSENANACLLRARSAMRGSPVVAEVRRTREGFAEVVLMLPAWRELLGPEEAGRWLERFVEAEELGWERLGDVWVLVRPGHLAPPLQHLLRTRFVEFGYWLAREGPR